MTYERINGTVELVVSKVVWLFTAVSKVFKLFWYKLIRYKMSCVVIISIRKRDSILFQHHDHHRTPLLLTYHVNSNGRQILIAVACVCGVDCVVVIHGP